MPVDYIGPGQVSPRIRHLCEQVHDHGPRVFCGFALELAEEGHVPLETLTAKLEEYAAIDANWLRVSGGDRFPHSAPFAVPLYLRSTAT